MPSKNLNTRKRSAPEFPKVSISVSSAPVVLLRKYCEMTGETPQAVYDRQRDEHWQRGEHYYVRRGRVWIDMRRVEKWIREDA